MDALFEHIIIGWAWIAPKLQIIPWMTFFKSCQLHIKSYGTLHFIQIIFSLKGSLEKDRLFYKIITH